jgi:molybdate transport system substrate-binding protein
MTIPKDHYGSRLRPALLAAALAGLSATACAQPRDGGELKVLISPGFAGAHDVLAPEFERVTGVTVVTARGGSTGDGPGAIPGRVARGEAVDVVILAFEGMDELIRSGGVDPASRVDLARTGVGMAVREGQPRPDISSLDALRRVLLEAETVAFSSGPSGAHLSTVVFPRLGIADEIASKAILTNNVPSALERGEAALGFQQVSELVPAAGIDFVAPIPAELQNMTSYAAAVATRSTNQELAGALIAFLASPAADPTIERLGLERIAAGGAGP